MSFLAANLDAAKHRPAERMQRTIVAGSDTKDDIRDMEGTSLQARA